MAAPWTSYLVTTDQVCAYISLDTSGIELKVSLHYVRKTTE